jgi:hypothetical protein
MPFGAFHQRRSGVTRQETDMYLRARDMNRLRAVQYHQHVVADDYRLPVQRPVRPNERLRRPPDNRPGRRKA